MFSICAKEKAGEHYQLEITIFQKGCVASKSQSYVASSYPHTVICEM